MKAAQFDMWETTAPPAPALPALTESLEADVAIVGAGYTGLSTALHLAEAGIGAVVLEAHEPGAGASGGNTGWLEPNWWMKTPAQIEQTFGTQRGEALTRWVAGGPQLLERWSARHSLSFDAVRRGLILASDDECKARALETQARDWQRAGVANEFLDRDALRSQIASDRYRGALWLRDGMALNPLALSRELARACAAQGVQLFTNSPVTAIARDGTRWRLDSPRGQVRASALVLATDAYTGSLWPAVSSAYWLWRCAVVASEPYCELDRLLTSRTPFADLNLANVFTLREGCGGRLITSTYAPVRSGLPPAAIAEPFMRKFRKIFPGRPEPSWQFAHVGAVGMSRDMLPRLCGIGPDAWAAFGYSGTGINYALLLGGELSQLVRSGDSRRSLYPVTPLELIPLRGALAWGLKYLHAPIARSVVSRVA